MRNKRTQKVALSSENMTNFGTFITCCNKRQWFGAECIERYDQGECNVCDKPLVIVSGQGKMFYVGNMIFDN